MKITLLDGNSINYSEPKTVLEIATDIAVSLGKKCVGALVNGIELVACQTIIDKDCKIEIVTNRHELYYQAVNYTARIVTILALKKLYPDMHPIFQNGPLNLLEFNVYYDGPIKIKYEDLEKIEKQANEIINSGYEFKKSSSDFNEVLKILPELNIKGKVEDLINKVEKQYIKFPLLDMNGESFFAVSALLRKTSDLFKIKITNLTGAYLNGDANNPMIQNIHGFAAVSEEKFNEIEKKLEEIKQRDHRFIAKNLDIFHFDPLIGQGLPIWLPNGTILKQEIKNYLKEKEFEYDFIQVETPVIGTSDLYKKSGHWDHYKDDMFAPMKLPKEEFVLKPMCCPHHIAVYNYRPRSYRELPLRFAEHTILHRYESSGSLIGLERVRSMELTDSHIFARQDQIEQEFKHCFNLISEVLQTFDIKVDYISLSVRDPKNKEKYYQDDKMWQEAEKKLEQVAIDLKINYKKMIGEAAFYGPKLDIQAKTSLGHEITVSTIQLDFLLPQKFDLTYIDKDGKSSRPIMIHRGLIGTYERFISVLLEQSKGVFPLWCAPVQIQIIPVNSVNNKYCKELRQLLKENKIRAQIDNRDERLSYKIREGQVKKIPYQLVIGQNEQDNNTVTYRKYGSEEQINISIQEFIDILLKQINSKK